MGAFHVVAADDAEHPCGRCGSVEIRVQFKFGDCQQHQYRIGDHLAWGGNDVGVQGLPSVTVLGDAECCATCGLDVEREYAVEIAEDVLVAVQRTSADTSPPLREVERQRGW